MYRPLCFKQTRSRLDGLTAFKIILCPLNNSSATGGGNATPRRRRNMECLQGCPPVSRKPCRGRCLGFLRWVLTGILEMLRVYGTSRGHTGQIAHHIRGSIRTIWLQIYIVFCQNFRVWCEFVEVSAGDSLKCFHAAQSGWKHGAGIHRKHPWSSKSECNLQVRDRPKGRDGDRSPKNSGGRYFCQISGLWRC